MVKFWLGEAVVLEMVAVSVVGVRVPVIEKGVLTEGEEGAEMEMLTGTLVAPLAGLTLLTVGVVDGVAVGVGVESTAVTLTVAVGLVALT